MRAQVAGDSACLNPVLLLQVILMAGLQGVGKTTACGKLAQYLKRQDRKVLLVATDVYRPVLMLMYMEMEMTHVITGQFALSVCSWMDGMCTYHKQHSWIFMFVLDDSSSNQPGIGWNGYNASG